MLFDYNSSKRIRAGERGPGEELLRVKREGSEGGGKKRGERGHYFQPRLSTTKR